jgi:signal transduction histidine kinase
LLILAVTFIVEGVIMLALPRIVQDSREPAISAVIDSVMLTLVLAPTLWMLVVRPLRRLSMSRGVLLSQLFSAQEQERARIARDLHDELGQQLTAVLINLRALEQSQTLQQATERAAAAHQAAAAGLEHVRRTARSLRPAILDDLGLAPAIERLCDEFQAAGNIALELELGLDPGARFTPEAELCLYRILQESLTNMTRHSSARHGRVVVRALDHRLELEVSDDGCGFDPAGTRGSFGLTGIQERAESLGGRCTIRSGPGAGTSINVVIPAFHRVEANPV